MINIPVWMFLTSYEKLRSNVLGNNTIINMLHLGRGVFGSDFGTTSFVIGKAHIRKFYGSYRRLYSRQGAVESIEQKEKWFYDGFGSYSASSDNYALIPGSPIAYWVSKKFIDCFQNESVSDVAQARLGMATANNDQFLRNWHEVSIHKIGFGMNGREIASSSGKKWFPYNKGGEYRKWYGNLDYVVNWENDGIAIRNFKDEKTGRIRSHNYNLDYIFTEGITWTFLSSSKFSARYFETGFLCDAVGCGLYADTSLLPYIEGLLCSCVAAYILNVLNPSISFQPGNIGSIPFCITDQSKDLVTAIAKNNIYLSRIDWDSFETSWDFKNHPLVCGERTIAVAFDKWERDAKERHTTLKANEEELNRIFIDIYGLQDDLTPEVEDKDVTIRCADIGREIRSFISYAVGCIFGRYSLDTEGLAYAGGDWDSEKYKSFIPDKDNILPLTDDEYFEDDLVGRFVAFVKIVFGVNTLEENIKFIAGALGSKGTPREVIRNYFMNEFYNDHCKIYKKRPIYWLFDSGKKNGFKALIYLHRYDENTIGNLRIDYLHKTQQIYENEILRMQDTIENEKDSREVAVAIKYKEKLIKQLQETKEYDEKIAHLALARTSIDLDDGVKVNYEKVQTDRDGKKLDVLAKI